MHTSTSPEVSMTYLQIERYDNIITFVNGNDENIWDLRKVCASYSSCISTNYLYRPLITILSDIRHNNGNHLKL